MWFVVASYLFHIVFSKLKNTCVLISHSGQIGGVCYQSNDSSENGIRDPGGLMEIRQLIEHVTLL